MKGSFLPSVKPEIWDRFPDYRALSVTARNFSIGVQTHSCKDAPTPAPWIEEHISAWRRAFRAFGANPGRTPSAIEALWKRFTKTGALPTISPVVDLYNALSIQFGAPFGGEDIDCYIGAPRLDLAVGTEVFDTTRDGTAVFEHPSTNEIIWRDEGGVTCRNWNWRQCRRTAISLCSSNLWFVIERLLPMPEEELERAGQALATALRELSPQTEISISVLNPIGEVA